MAIDWTKAAAEWRVRGTSCIYTDPDRLGIEIAVAPGTGEMTLEDKQKIIRAVAALPELICAARAVLRDSEAPGVLADLYDIIAKIDGEKE